VAALERHSTEAVELLTSYSGTVFVATVSLLSFVPNGSWLPVVVRPETWTAARPPLENGRRPVVLHVPSSSHPKASDSLDPVLSELERRGRISYRRASGVPPSEMPDLYHAADIVVDRLGLGDYGVVACEAMAAGRIVLGHVSDAARQQVRDRSGLDLPIIEATPANISEVIDCILDDREAAQSTAALGPAFVSQIHDGRMSGEVVATFLDARDEDRRETPRRPRGRVVMLVDNQVVRDSRVQKQARSAAARGWKVWLIGEQRGPGRTTWRLGEARVQLVKVGKVLTRQRHLLRSGHLRSPLAYHRPDLASYREQQMLVRRSSLSTERARLRMNQSEGVRGFPIEKKRLALLLQRLSLGVTRRWVGLRATKTRHLQLRRTRMDAPLDRLTTSFWERTMGDRSWRRLDPGLWEWELAYGPVIDKLKPDIIHANDFRMLGVGARAVLRARAKGRDIRLVWDAHEFLPGIKPWNSHPRWHVAQQAYEREYAQYADAVITVSESLADLLVAEHGLTTRPTVVLNAPAVSTARVSTVNLRESCGVGSDVPLLVYSGNAAPQRGLDTMVEALAMLPKVHIALVVPVPKSPYVTALRQRAAALGASGRLHILPYVAVDDIVSFLSSADAGVIPILHFPNHEIALITKFLEYSHARLPIVVSDVKTMAEMVRRTGQGEVFEAENLDDFICAVQAVLAAPDRYRRAYDKHGLLQQWTWEHSADSLDAVYERLRSQQLAARERATKA
jgi:glycosyltransferase involved in cell wall biosynthesis